MANILFEDKQNFATNPLVPNTKKVRAEDFNEIKTVVNGKADKVHEHTASDITDFPTSLPASGGNSATVGGKTPEVLQNYANLQNKPTSFPPSKHSHDDLYFTETEVTEKLKSKADDVTYKNNMLQLTADGAPIGTPIEVVSGSGGSGGLSSDTLPVGSMVPFSGTIVTEGWLLCEGQAVSRATYKSLFDVIGTSYGAGDGSTTFNVPEMSNPLSYDVVDIVKGATQFKTTDPEAYYIIKARQMIPFDSSVVDTLTSNSKTDALSAAQGMALKELYDMLTLLNNDKETIYELSSPPTTFVVESGVYTDAKFTTLNRLCGRIEFLKLVDNKAICQLSGYYHIEIESLWWNAPSILTGSVQIRLNNLLKTSVKCESFSATGSMIMSTSGYVQMSKGAEVPISLFQSTGESRGIKSLNVKINMIKRI